MVVGGSNTDVQQHNDNTEDNAEGDRQLIGGVSSSPSNGSARALSSFRLLLVPREVTNRSPARVHALGPLRGNRVCSLTVLLLGERFPRPNRSAVEKDKAAVQLLMLVLSINPAETGAPIN